MKHEVQITDNAGLTDGTHRTLSDEQGAPDRDADR